MADDEDMAESFRERRAEARLLCADLMQIEWTDERGVAVTACANLEDISPSGACVQLDRFVRPGTAVRLVCARKQWGSRVRYCAYRDTGYFAGLQFEPGERWDQGEFEPEHLLDPRDLLKGRAGE